MAREISFCTKVAFSLVERYPCRDIRPALTMAALVITGPSALAQRRAAEAASKEGADTVAAAAEAQAAGAAALIEEETAQFGAFAADAARLAASA